VDIAPPRRDGAGRRLRRISSRVGSVTAELARAFLSMLRTVAIQADRSGSAARAGNPGEELSTDERRISLRVKVPAEDGTAVVEMTGPAVPENGLQVFGDWVLAPLEQHADGAADAARHMVAALRERDWEGDDVLADQLDGSLGSGAMPDLRPLPVDLDELAGILEGDPVYGGGRVDLATGEVWPAPAVDALVEYRRALCQLLESVGGSLYPVYPYDGDQVPFDLVQHPVRADAQPTVGAADERARRRWIVS